MSARHSSAGLWKPEEDDQLRALAASGESSFEIGRLLHHSPSALRKRASLLGITVQAEGEMSKSPIITTLQWTQADDDQLRAFAAAGESCSTIAELSKRSHSSIRRRARWLKIKLARSRPGPKTKTRLLRS